MRRVNWTITEAQHQTLKRLSQDTGLSISELVRRALDHYVQAVGRKDAHLVSSKQREADHER